MVDTPLKQFPSPNDEIELGARLKFIREHNGLSQRELAKRAGVPHSSISMIEQGTNSPSINSLAKILGGIPMSLAHFFSCDISLLSQHVYRSVDLGNTEQTIARGISLQKIPLPYNERSLYFSRICYAAGLDTGESPKVKSTSTAAFVIEGAIELTINAEVSIVNSGDAFVLTAHQPHRLRNISPNQNCIVLMCEF